MKCAGWFGAVLACFLAFTMLAVIHREAVREISRWQATRHHRYAYQELVCTPKGVPDLAILASLQDASHRGCLTGGAPLGDHRLISAILSG